MTHEVRIIQRTLAVAAYVMVFVCCVVMTPARRTPGFARPVTVQQSAPGTHWWRVHTYMVRSCIGIQKEMVMAAWEVTGAGNADYNGTYTEAGTYESKPYYTNANGKFLIWWTTLGKYILTNSNPPSISTYYAASGDAPYLPNNPWSLGGHAEATAPAPTLSEATSVTYTPLVAMF